MFNVGEEIKLEISGLSSNGSGVGRVNGFVVFVENALTGETVKARITKICRNHAEATTQEIISESPHRIKRSCKAQNCGGCVLMCLKYEKQLEHKLCVVNDALKRIGSLETQAEEIIGMEVPFRYRNKARFHANDGKIGFFAHNSHEVTDISDCIITHEMNKTVIKEAKKIENLPQEILFRVGFNTGEILTNPQILGKTDFIYEKLSDVNFRVSADSFFQVNTVQAEQLYKTALEFAAPDNETVVDAYCGTGSIGLYFSKKASPKKIIGIEINEKAVRDAKINAALNQVQNASFINGYSENIFKEIAKEASVVVVDPPRSGCGKKLLKSLIDNKKNVRRLVYVSCDPATFARDAKILSEGGFYLQRIKAFDMFPQTAEVETAAIFI
ncbi:MAG: 23S rRNA (uracil(1939)-C(5))-methyltransferase RlmD [Clostridiales bacterium]|jgi:23S rRNA (uracil1939-C5)-methyltransferase|nr:23S rRNA (uracil(1939)-C(5))-methyltransferase RlmD [Clostridiales bacterium]